MGFIMDYTGLYWIILDYNGLERFFFNGDMGSDGL